VQPVRPAETGQQYRFHGILLGSSVGPLDQFTACARHTMV